MTTESTPIPNGAEWNKLLGPFFSVHKVSQLLGQTEEEIRERYKERTLLGCETQEGVLVFPSFQFVQNEQNQSWGLIKGLDKVLSAFSDIEVGAFDWTLASWIRTKRRDLGKSIEEHLRNEEPIERILRIAHDASARWST